jgi:hypothetical protein
MDQEMYDGLLAETAAVNTAVIKALSAVAEFSGDRKTFLQELLDAGLHDLPKTLYQGIPQDRYPAFLEMAKARYKSLVKAIRRE